MDDMIKALIPLIIGGVLGGFITTYFDFRKQIMSEVWAKRFTQYKKLWFISGNLPEWPRDTTVTYNKLFNISVSLKNWYFNDGGILLSSKSRELYGKLQKVLIKKAIKDSKDHICKEDYDLVKSSFKILRDQMTRDLSSRSRKLIS